MPGFSCSALAREVDVSRQGVHQALKRGILRVGVDGLIDPTVAPNRSWISLHSKGHDYRGREMWTYAGRKVPPAVCDTFDIHDEAALDAFMEEGLAELQRTAMSDEELNEIARAAADALAGNDRFEMSPIDQRFLSLLEEMRAEQRDGLRRISERLDEMNLRLRILRDPFQAMTVAGRRLVQRDEAQRSATGAAGARQDAQKSRRLP